MESEGEDLDNIFEEYESTENDRVADDTENAQTTNETTTEGVKVPVPKRVVRNPRLKFNPERLCGERGIPILLDHFKGFKFKGAGQEKEDLDKLLSKLEHWTHRLFPSMKFEDCLHQIEKLGKKRPVQTCLRKIRLDMPILSSDFVHEEEDDVQRNDDPEPVEVDAFDRLLEESRDVLEHSAYPVENVADSNSVHSSPVQNLFGRGHILGSSSGSNLTEDQKERMERNKMLAAERRKARLAAMQQNPPESESAKNTVFAPHLSNQQDESFDSLLKNQRKLPVITDGSVMELDDENIQERPLKISDLNADGLELDDLVELVNEEETNSDKNGAAITFISESQLSNNEIFAAHKSSNRQNKAFDSLLQNQENIPSNEAESVIDLDNNENIKSSLSELNNQNVEDLQLDDLVDLLDEEETGPVPSVSKSQSKSHDIFASQDISLKQYDSAQSSLSNLKNKSSITESSTMDLDCGSENILEESLERNNQNTDLVEKEPDPYKDFAATSEKSQATCTNMANVLTNCIISEADQVNIEQNIEMCSSNFNNEFIVKDETSIDKD